MAKGDWRGWKLKQWNDALVEAVFMLDGHSRSPISRMDATTAFFARVTSQPPSGGEKARDAFLASFAPYRNCFSWLFHLHACAPGWTPKSKDFPFFSQLYLTIVVASADEDTFDDGNFRSRLARRLGLDTDSLPLEGLANLWERAAEWSNHDARENVRRLKLPPPEHETRIGYSKRLAFPRFRDQRQLELTLRNRQLDTTSPVNEIALAIQCNSRQFTPSFNQEFGYFHELVKNGAFDEAAGSPFWGAVSDITWQREERARAAPKSELAFELDVGDSQDPILVLVTRNPRVTGIGFWNPRPRSIPDQTYKYRLESRTEPRSPLLRALRDPRARTVLSGSFLESAMEYGCIAFTEERPGTWISTRKLEFGESFWLVLKGSRWARLKRDLDIERLEPAHAVPFRDVTDWILAGPFHMSEALRAVADRELAATGLFALRLRPSFIRTLGGIRLPEGYLFLPNVLPAAVMQGAARIGWRKINDDDALADQPDWTDFEAYESAGEKVFTFSPDAVDRVTRDTTLELVAHDEKGVRLSKSECPVVRACLTWKIKQPPDLARYWVAGDEGHLISATGEREESDLIASEELRDEALLFHPLTRSRSARVREPVRVGLGELPGRWHDMLEIITATFVRCAVTSSLEFHGLICGVSRQSPTDAWYYITDLVENGFIRRLYSRRWEGHVFCGMPAEIHASESGGVWIGRVVGLTPSTVRRNLLAAARANGSDVEALFSPDGRTAGALEINARSRASLEAISAASGIPLKISLPPSDWRLPRWDTILMSERLQGHGDRLTWLEAEKRFVPSTRVSGAHPRLDRFHSEGWQDTYKLTLSKGQWITRSREWALAGHAAACGRFGTVAEDGSVLLSRTELVAPPSISRSVLKWGGGVCFRDEARNRIYPAGAAWRPADPLSHWIEHDSPKRASPAMMRLQLALQIHRRSA